MKRLIQKMFRDIWQMKAQFICIFIMCFLGIFIYTGIEGVWNGMQMEKDTFFQKTNLADVWITGADLQKTQLDKIEELSCVNEGQLSAVLNAYMDEEQEKSIRLIANDINKISKPMVIKGEKYRENGNGIWLDAEYASTNQIEIGDYAEIFYNNKMTRLKVKGYVCSPEYISDTGSSAALMPDHEHYAYGFVSMKTMSGICENMTYNQIKLVMDKKYDEMQMKTDVKCILDESYFNCFNRMEWGGVSGFLNKINQIKKMSLMFSLLFFLMTLLTIETTMKRIVKKQRSQIGILKALGFQNYQIEWHYALYGLIISVAGAFLGLFAAPYTITPVLMDLQKRFYSLPEWSGQYSGFSFVLAVFMIFICSFTALASCSGIVKKLPANLLRDESPLKGKKLFIENFGFFWNELDFEWKWSFRDMFRNKARTLIGIAGVLGSMMLLMASFGLKDSVNYINEKIYGRQYSYYERMEIKNVLEEKEKSKIEKILDGSYQWISEGIFEVQSHNRKKTENMFILDEGFYYSLYDEKNRVVLLPAEGAVLTKKVASELGVMENEIVRVNSTSGIFSFKVAQIVNINSPQGIFLSKEAWEFAGGVFSPTVLFAGDNQKIDEIEDLGKIGRITLLEKQMNESNEVLDSVRMIIFLLLAAAVLLSIVILYNLGVLSYTERNREYATLRVLGFYNSEIKKIIFKDSMIHVAVGWLLGIPAGFAFLKMYVKTISTTTMIYSAYLKGISFAASTMITVGCSFFVNYAVCRKVSKLDMVQSLKSVE